MDFCAQNLRVTGPPRLAERDRPALAKGSHATTPACRFEVHASMVWLYSCSCTVRVELYCQSVVFRLLLYDMGHSTAVLQYHRDRVRFDRASRTGGQAQRSSDAPRATQVKSRHRDLLQVLVRTSLNDPARSSQVCKVTHTR